MPIFLTIVLILSGATGITLASQNALPGNVLYPVKIETESIRSVLSFSTEEKAQAFYNKKDTEDNYCQEVECPIKTEIDKE